MSASQIDTLIKMINQIAANLSAYPTEEAADKIVSHLQRFWAPQMQQLLLNHTNAVTEGLSPLSQLAIKKLAAVPIQKTS